MDAFISYSTLDKGYAANVKQVLTGYDIDTFLAHEDLLVSEEWKERILQELKSVDLFVAVLSNNYRTSLWCEQELGFIISRPEVLIIPLSVDGTTPYGFISHLQGQGIGDLAHTASIIESALFRKRPRLMIPLQIVKVGMAGSYRGAEALVRPLVPVFAEFTDEEMSSFVEAATGNSEVRDAADCRSKYLPQFLKVNSDRMKDEDRKKLVDTLKFRQ